MDAITFFSVILLFPPYCSGSVQLDAPFAINFSISMAAATTTASYSFTDEEVSRLAKCDDQPEFLLLLLKPKASARSLVPPDW